MISNFSWFSRSRDRERFSNLLYGCYYYSCLLFVSYL